MVVAPMGYGKTLAVQYFLQEQERCGKKVLRQSMYGAGAEAFWQGVCHSWQGTELGAALLQQSLPADANAKTLVLELFRQLLPPRCLPSCRKSRRVCRRIPMIISCFMRRSLWTAGSTN